MKNVILVCLVLCSFILPVHAAEITVVAAANLQFSLEEIKSTFESQTGHTVKTVFGSSGKLTTQIENGAPFDVFMSADIEYPKRLNSDGLTLGEPKVYAKGVLVLWTMNNVDLSNGVASLMNNSIKKIAIASPKTAPYGKQAVNAMKYFQLYPSLESKLVYGESIAQANEFIITQAADVGFTSKSIVVAPNMKDKGKWVEVDPKAYDAIAQAVVILKHAQQNKMAADEFYNFLFSNQAQEIFEKFGYTRP